MATQQGISYPLQLESTPALDPREFDFAFTGGGGVTVPGISTAGAKTATFTISPLGVSGTDSNHYIYINDVTTPANSEAVLITGGTATPLSVGGTLTFTTLNAHTGSWQLMSATAGIQEAANSLPTAGNGGGAVEIPLGTFTIYATITIATKYVTIRGIGRVGTTLTTAITTGPLFNFSASSTADQNALLDMDLQGPADGVTTQFAIACVNQVHMLVERISISGFGQGISHGPSNSIVCRDVLINGIIGDGIYIDTTNDGGLYEDVQIGGYTNKSSVGWHVEQCVGLRLVNCYVNGMGIGMYFSPASGETVGVVLMVNVQFDGFQTWSSYGVHVSPASGGVVNTIIWQSGGAGGWEYGILHDGAGAIVDIVYNNLMQFGNSISGGYLNYGKNMLITDCFFENNGGGTNPGLSLLGGSDIIVRGGLYGAGSYANFANTQTYGIQVQNTTFCQISDLIATPNLTGAIQNGGSNTGLRITNVIGYNPVGRSAITVGASPFTFTAGPTPTNVYVSGGTVSSIKIGTTQVATTSPATIMLWPNSSVTVTYSVAPTMVEDIG